MKKYWYTSLLAFSLLISAIASTLPASVYGIVTSVFVRVCSNGQETTENIDAELSAGKYDLPETSQAENVRRIQPSTVLLLWFQNILLIKTIPQKAFPWKLPLPTA